jgi:hypothetical protein
VSTIKADTGRHVGDGDSRPVILGKTRGRLARAQKSGLLIDPHTKTCGDSSQFTENHGKGKEMKGTTGLAESSIAAHTGLGIRKKLFTAGALAVKAEPKITPIYIDQTRRDWITVCLVQLDFDTRLLAPPREFGLTLAEEHVDMTRRKVFTALQIAREAGVNIVCFPELSVLSRWVEPAKRESGNMVIVFGTSYHRQFNTSQVIIGERIYRIRKINPAPAIEEITGPRRGMRKGREIPVFHTQFGRFVVLICLDYMKESYRIVHNSDPDIRNVDFIINPCYNKDVANFQQQANLDCQRGNYPYILQVNAVAAGGQRCGGTCVIGVENNKSLTRYEDEGYRPKKDPIRYKLIEARGEMMLTFALNLDRRGVQVPSEVKMTDVVMSVYQNGAWQSV